MSRYGHPAPHVHVPLSRAALGRTRMPILIALGLAVGARLLVEPVPDPGLSNGTSIQSTATLPDRAYTRPEARPTLPSGLALAVQPVVLTPLPLPADG